MTIPATATEIHLASRPVGLPTSENFSLVEAPVPDPGEGEVLVRNDYLSVDPYMRGRMNDVKSYVPPFAVGEVMDGGAVGTVVASRSDELSVGDTVLHNYGWREYASGPARHFRLVDTTAVPASCYLSVLGMPGQTAYFGLLDVAAMRPGDTVFVSGAAGAVGSLVGQFAKLRGAKRVIGSAGSAEKVSYLREELGFDAAFDYRSGPVGEQLAEAAPGGIDVYFDNVGGDHLEAALTQLRTFGRIAMCGAITQYNNTEPAPGPRNLFLAVTKRLRMRGFIVTDFSERTGEFLAEVSRWVAADQVSVRETVYSGIGSAPDAFLGLFAGDNTGKMLVRLGRTT
ncbi:NADP-dependent oxidoreductase [Haloechinothrix sp. LS1_15]|uniref:NADP-dependent oxidoreductase n=1 Tax=Haloechinothrix sp. LS1_15 TaxID=2652248 RepID=UPI00294744A9|nr:NADP-dependent oxidoreductase [Haloechinothrix sp. LS1_15]MDV6011272.1 NADP-dependent oxidoreductase [Haloechinothrix sp. LS1_15]